MSNPDGEYVLLNSLVVILSTAETLQKINVGAVASSELHYNNAENALNAIQTVREHCNILEDAIRSSLTKGKARSAGTPAASVWQPASPNPLAIDTTVPVSSCNVSESPLQVAHNVHQTNSTCPLTDAPLATPFDAVAVESTDPGFLGTHLDALQTGYASGSQFYPQQHQANLEDRISTSSGPEPVSLARIPLASRPSEMPNLIFPPSTTVGNVISVSLPTQDRFTPVTPKTVDFAKSYVACRSIVADPAQDMSINVKPGDRLELVMIMDDERTALGTNAATGATGTFPLSDVCLLAEWNAISMASEKAAAVPDKPSLSAATTASASEVVGLYVAIVSHQASNDIEVSFNIGDEIEVISATNDGDTVFGLHMRTKSEGIFRLSQLKVLSDGRSGNSQLSKHSQAVSHVFGEAGEPNRELYAAEPAHYTADNNDNNGKTVSRTPSSSSFHTHPEIPSGIPILPRNSSLRSNHSVSTMSETQNDASAARSVDLLLADRSSTSSSTRSAPPTLTPRGESRSAPFFGDAGHDGPSQRTETGIDRDSVLALIAAFQEDNAAAYKLYVQNSVPLKNEGKPIPAAMNIELMKQLTENMAQYNWDVAEQERRLREIAAAGPAPASPNEPENAELAYSSTIPRRRLSRKSSLNGLRRHSHDGASELPQHAEADRTSPHADTEAPPTPTSSPLSQAAKRKSVELAEQRRAAAQAVVDELSQTEQHYVHELQVFVDHWMIPITTNINLPKMEVGHIFRNIPELLSLGLKVARQLEIAAQNLHNDRSVIGNVFLDHVEEWNVYIKYVENFSRAKRTIRTLEENGHVGEIFTEALKACQRRPESKRNDIEHYMILPVQRISRYWLLLQRLKKYTDEDDPSYEMVEVAEQYMFQIGSVLDHAKRRDDESHRMFEIVLEVDGCPVNIVSYTQRRYVGEWEVRDLAAATSASHVSMGVPAGIAITSRTGSGPSGRRLKIFLFSDCFLQCSIKKPKDVKGTKIYDFINRVDIEDLVVVLDNRDESVVSLRGPTITTATPNGPIRMVRAFTFALSDAATAHTFAQTMRQTISHLAKRKEQARTRLSFESAASAVAGARVGGDVGVGGIPFADDLLMDDLYNKG